MRSSGKSRNKNRNNGRRPNPGNVLNRVFDSAGPEGKVRGTPQQIIEKYQSLAHDHSYQAIEFRQKTFNSTLNIMQDFF